jgi:acetate kinase
VTTTTAPAVLAVNVGSSSLKCALFTYEADPRPIARESFNGAASSCLPRLLDWIDRQEQHVALAAIGHRIVHGGSAFREPQPLTPDVLDTLQQLIPFAPNHLPDEIALIEALQHRRPAVPQIACFDTAFHADLPDVVRRLPIPDTYDALGVRRYGFHGLSYAFLLQELERIGGLDAARGRVILAHLGNGSSLAAVRDGRSIDTTMAFTPIGGVVMSTRSGDLDPGVVTYLARIEQASADHLEDLLSHRAGLLGISGTSGDMRTLLTSEMTDSRDHLAVMAYVYGIKKAIGALAAALGGLDTIVFSGGIGEHAPTVRSRVCDGLEFLGVQIDPDRNRSNAPVISAAAARIIVRVIPTDEELMIARATCRLLGRHSI